MGASIGSGLLEAIFLIVVTRAAFGISTGAERFPLAFGIEVTTAQLVLTGLALVILRLLLMLTANLLSARISAAVVASIRTQLGTSFLRSSWPAQHGQRVGKLQELLTTFTNEGAGLVGSTAAAVIAACNLAALLAVAMIVDPLASLVVVVAVAVLGVCVRPLRQAVWRQADRVAASGMDYASSLGEISQLGMEMHIFNVQPAAEARISRLIQQHQRTTIKLEVFRSAVPTTYTALAYLLIILALAVLAGVGSGNLESVGAVMLVMLRSLSYGLSLQTSFAAMNSTMPFLEALNAEIARYDNARVIDLGEPIDRLGTLRLEEVWFAYEPDEYVLREISVEVAPHEIVGIIGPSGSGKSTLVQVMLGLREPTRGQVLAEGREIRSLSRTQWARKVTFVPQDAHLVAGSVADNIRFYRDGVSQADIERAARLANLHDDVTGWEEGYDRFVGEQGSHLSGGQQQRLVIARALVERPDMLILDEPTSALDVRSEHLIRETLEELRSEMAIVIIAHRMSTLESCDRIMVLQDGEVRACDTPQQLKKSSTFYREALQLSGIR